MPIKSVTSDKDALSLTVIGEYPVPVERLWEAYTDPRQLERFWGPESWPATFSRHDMAVGGRSEYHMTGPDGSSSRGWWRFLAVEPFRRTDPKLAGHIAEQGIRRWLPYGERDTRVAEGTELDGESKPVVRTALLPDAQEITLA